MARAFQRTPMLDARATRACDRGCGFRRHHPWRTRWSISFQSLLDTLAGPPTDIQALRSEFAAAVASGVGDANTVTRGRS